jgi:hypothetical protein
MSRPARHRRARCTRGAARRHARRTRSSSRSGPSRCNDERTPEVEARRARSTSGVIDQSRTTMTPDDSPMRAIQSSRAFRRRETRSCGTSPRRPPMRGRKCSRPGRSPSTTSTLAGEGNQENACDPGLLKQVSNLQIAAGNHMFSNNNVRISTAGHCLFILPCKRFKRRCKKPQQPRSLGDL